MIWQQIIQILNVPNFQVTYTLLTYKGFIILIRMTSCLLYESLELIAPFQISIKQKYTVLTRIQEIDRHKGGQKYATVVISSEAGRGRNTHSGTHHSQDVDTWYERIKTHLPIRRRSFLLKLVTLSFQAQLLLLCGLHST